jgi:arabinogalactan oligomer/maltooligosaccharide transport system permease protein
MLLPTFLAMLFLVIYPLFQAFKMSFTNADQFNSLNVFMEDSYGYVGFQNYIQVLKSTEFRQVFIFTIVWTLINVFFHYGLGLTFAIMLNREMRFRSAYRLLLLIPWAMPTFISAFAWRFIFNSPYGFLHQFLIEIGIENPPAFLGSDLWSKVAVILVNVWLGVPFMIVTLLGGLQNIDSELIEASKIDGANAFQRFKNVTMPGLRAVSATVILLGLIWTFNSFAVIYLVTGGGPGTSTQILSTYAYAEAFDFKQYGTATAWGVIILSMLLVFTSFYRRTVRRSGEETW